MRISCAANGSVLSSSNRKLWLALLLWSTMACFILPSTCAQKETKMHQDQH
jgi:hypothetical protein